jgi:hypothetical protein
MTLNLTAIALLLLLTTFSPVALGQKKCSCNAPDNSCKAAATCRDGGAAICSSNSACYATCGGVDPGNSQARISLKLRRKKAEEVTAALKRRSGRNIIFEPTRKTDRFTFELNNVPLWTILDFLNGRGKVLLDGLPFDMHKELRRRLSRGGKVSVSFIDSTARNAVAKLAFQSGLSLRVRAGDAERLLSISLEEVTLDEIVARISAESGVKIERTSTK